MVTSLLLCHSSTTKRLLPEPIVVQDHAWQGGDWVGQEGFGEKSEIEVQSLSEMDWLCERAHRGLQTVLDEPGKGPRSQVIVHR